MIVQVKGELTGSSTVHVGTLLEDAIGRGIGYLTLDFSAVSDFDQTGIALLVSVLDLYGRYFSRIICCGLPQKMSSTLKGLGVENIPGVEIVSIDDPKAAAVGNPRFILFLSLN
jgi:anti-anti-sigma regulatory factor